MLRSASDAGQGRVSISPLIFRLGIWLAGIRGPVRCSIVSGAYGSSGFFPHIGLLSAVATAAFTSAGFLFLVRSCGGICGKVGLGIKQLYQLTDNICFVNDISESVLIPQCS